MAEYSQASATIRRRQFQRAPTADAVGAPSQVAERDRDDAVGAALTERAAPPSAEGTGRAKEKLPRRKQKRAVETRQAILGAALQEFARKGFDAASMRDIADRLGIKHPLITYHFKSKEMLWRAVAQHIMAEIQEEMDFRTRDVGDVKPVDRVRAEFMALLAVQHKYPDFHHFMLNESRENSPRLQWLAHNLLTPIVNANLPEIRRAQAAGHLPVGEPVLLHYMLVGMTTVLVSLAAEIEAVTGFSVNAAGVEEAYSQLIDRVMFCRDFGSSCPDLSQGED